MVIRIIIWNYNIFLLMIKILLQGTQNIELEVAKPGLQS